MDKAQLLAKLREIRTRERNGKVFGEEQDHMDADEALLGYIGDAEISEVFDEIDKWYS